MRKVSLLLSLLYILYYYLLIYIYQWIVQKCVHVNLNFKNENEKLNWIEFVLFDLVVNSNAMMPKVRCVMQSKLFIVCGVEWINELINEL